MPRPPRDTALRALRHRRAGPGARFAAGPRVEDALRVATELVAGGRRVALEHVPGRDEDPVAVLASLAVRLSAVGPAGGCELTVPADRLGADGTAAVVAAAADAGTAVCVTGRAGPVGPGVRTAVPAGDPAAEERCRALAGRPVRLVAGRGAAADRTLARCVNVLLAGTGHVAVAAAEPRLVAVVGERAAWFDRPSDTWELVMPYGVRTADQHRLVAAGTTVRVAVPSGPGAPMALLRRLARGGAA
jgi:proline dehydrogenase